MGAAQSGSSPGGWIKSLIAIPVMLYSQTVNWANPMVLMGARLAFALSVGMLVFAFWQAKTRVQYDASHDEDYRSRKVWVRKRKPKSGMLAMFFGDAEADRPKASEYEETSLAAMDLAACETGFNSSVSAALMPFGASMFFGVHFMMAMQLVNAPFTMFQDKVLEKFFWGPLQGEGQVGDVDAIFPKPSDVLLQDPAIVPPTLQLTRRQMRRKLLRDGKDASKVVEETAPATEGVVVRTASTGLARLTAAGNADAPAESGTSTELTASAEDGADPGEYATFGEGYDEVMEDVIFSAWEDDEAINVRAVEALKEGGKNSLQYSTDDDGWTLLMVACGTRAMPQRAVERLIELGCGPLRAQDSQGWTCLHWAAEHDCPQAVRGVGRWLLGRAPSAVRATPEAVEELLGARSRTGATALALAEANGHSDTAEALRELEEVTGAASSAASPVLAAAAAVDSAPPASEPVATAAPTLRRQNTSEPEPMVAEIGELD